MVSLNALNNFISILLLEEVNPIIEEHDAFCFLNSLEYSNNLKIRLTLIGPCSACKSLELTRTAIRSLLTEELKTKYNLEIEVLYE